ncbi:unnamed protein product [Urochloa humidicola]
MKSLPPGSSRFASLRRRRLLTLASRAEAGVLQAMLGSALPAPSLPRRPTRTGGSVARCSSATGDRHRRQPSEGLDTRKLLLPCRFHRGSSGPSIPACRKN